MRYDADPPVYGFKRWLKQEIERLVSRAVPVNSNLKQDVQIVDITFFFHNKKIMELLEGRHEAIKKSQTAKQEFIEE